ncbi:hypothetical protein ACJX0J_005427, partial [Zea mays]
MIISNLDTTPEIYADSSLRMPHYSPSLFGLVTSFHAAIDGFFPLIFEVLRRRLTQQYGISTCEGVAPYQGAARFERFVRANLSNSPPEFKSCLWRMQFEY